jgi:hypothetical protein
MNFLIVSCAIDVVIGMLCSGMMDYIGLSGTNPIKRTKTTIDTLIADNSFKSISLSVVETVMNKNKNTNFDMKENKNTKPTQT